MITARALWAAETKLFKGPDDTPVPLGLRQRALGICSLVALINSMTLKHPQLLKRIFEEVDGPAGLYRLHLYNYDPANPNGPDPEAITLDVNDEFPHEPNDPTQLWSILPIPTTPGELYGLLLIKAIAILSDAPDYSMAQMDTPSLVEKCWRIFTGGRKENVNIHFNEANLQTVANSDNGKIHSHWPTCMLASRPPPHLHHVYSALRVENGNVRIHNPHGLSFDVSIEEFTNPVEWNGFSFFSLIEPLF